MREPRIGKAMLVETVAQIRHEHFVEGKTIPKMPQNKAPCSGPTGIASGPTNSIGGTVRLTGLAAAIAPQRR